MAVRQKRQGRLFDKEMMWKKKKKDATEGQPLFAERFQKKKKTRAHNQTLQEKNALGYIRQ